MKHLCSLNSVRFVLMPPTRGHDLKLTATKTLTLEAVDAPHTGARLETEKKALQRQKQSDAPHTGARLETNTLSVAMPSCPGCPPHGGTT